MTDSLPGQLELELPSVPLRRCKDCGTLKYLIEFRKHKTSLDGYTHQCKACVAVESLAYYHSNKVRILARNRAWNKENKNSISVNTRRWVLKKYGMTFEAFQALWDKQEGKCAICEKLLDRVTGDCQIDHKHVEDEEKHDKATGPVRGLLCRQCNWGIANFQENKVVMLAAIAYLEEHEDGQGG